MNKQSDLAQRLKNHVYTLAGDIGARSLTNSPESLHRAAGYIEHTFQSYGLQSHREEFDVEVYTQKNRKITADSISFESVNHSSWNVVVELPDDTNSGEVVIVGAHYDSVYDCPGANDNASGVAALLEIARELKERKIGKTLRFVAFTNEEPPFFRTAQMGSFRHAQSCSANNERVVAMICLETIGFYTKELNSQKYPHPLLKLIAPSVGDFVSFISNFDSSSLLNQCLKSFRQTSAFSAKGLALPMSLKGIQSSDHANFWKFKYKAVMVTDTANYRYPHYHELEDTPDKLNYESMAEVVSGLASMVYGLCR